MAKRSISKGVIKDIVIVVVAVVVIWIGLQAAFGTQNPFYVVASGSMIPALEVYDIIVIQGHQPFEEVAENLVLAERGQYICNSCNASIAEYREFKKPNEGVEVGGAKPLDANVSPPVEVPTLPKAEAPPAPVAEAPPAPVAEAPPAPVAEVTQPGSSASVSSIEGRMVVDENANKVGTAKQVGIDGNTQSMVLVISKNDGTEGSIPWASIKKVGEVILLGKPEETVAADPGKCSECGFINKDGSKFCEECGAKI